MGLLERFIDWVGEVADRHADGRARRTYEVKNGFDEPRSRREHRLLRDDDDARLFAKSGMSGRHWNRWQSGDTDRMGSEPVRIKWWEIE